MAVLTVLEIARRACAATGLPVPNSIVGSTDPNVVQLVELLHEEGSELAARTEWQVMTWEATFTSVADESQGSIATIVDSIDQAWRTVVKDTMWDRTAREPIIGPLSPREWQTWKANQFAGPYKRFRISLNRILIAPTMEAGHTIAFEFTSRFWLLNAAGTVYKEFITANDDLPVLDTDLMLAGLKWRSLQRRGLSYGELFEAYERRVTDAIAKDGTKSTRCLGESDLSGIPQAIPRLIGS